MQEKGPYLLLTLIFLLVINSFGQSKKSRKDSIRQEKISQGKLVFSQVGAPGYGPETGFLLGSASVFTFSTSPADTTVTRSTIPLVAFISITGSYGVKSYGVLEFKKKWRWMNNFEYTHMVDNYWGTGYEDGSSLEQGESTTYYTRNHVKWDPKILNEVKSNLFLGIQTDLNYNKILETNPVMDNEEAYLKYGDKVKSFGVGAVVQYDTRDMVVNAWKGSLFEVIYLTYPSVWATGDGYSILNMDYRQFKTLGSGKGRVLAWNIRSKIGFGDIPYTELPAIGSGFDMRGYYAGQYRDQNSGALMVEYRHTFKKQGELSKHGFVVWTAAGQVWDDKMEWSHTLPVIGTGYRFALQHRINVRLDAGIGKDSSVFYFNITEAF